jgi:hypothetical protein
LIAEFDLPGNDSIILPTILTETLSKMDSRIEEFAWFNGDPNPLFTHKFQKALPSSEFLHTFDRNLKSWVFGHRLFAQQLAEISGRTSLVSGTGEIDDSGLHTSLLETLP